jgi:hypothetical protein
VVLPVVAEHDVSSSPFAQEPPSALAVPPQTVDVLAPPPHAAPPPLLHSLSQFCSTHASMVVPEAVQPDSDDLAWHAEGSSIEQLKLPPGQRQDR